MELLPIVSLTDLANGIVSAAIVVYLWVLNDGQHRPGLWLFIGFYASLSVFWFFFAVPELVVVDAYSITVLTLVGYQFLFLALIFLLQIPALLADRQIYGYAGGVIVTILAAVFFIEQLANVQLDERLVVPPYVFWQEVYDSWSHYIPGMTALLAAGTSAVAMVVIARGEAAGSPRKRAALAMAGGLGFLALAAVVYFLLSSGGFQGSIWAAGAATMGLLIFLYGVVHLPRWRQEEA